VDVEQISQNIKFFREQHNLTQQQLADQLQMSRSVVAKWENELVVPDILSLLKLSHIFQISLDHLVGNKIFHQDVIKEFKYIYQTEQKSIEDEMIELTEYIMMNPSLKETLQQLKTLPIRKQQSIQRIVNQLLKEYEHI